MAGVTVSNSTRVTKVRNLLKQQIDSNFSATLGREPDIVNIVSALIYHESRFNVNAIGGTVSFSPGTGGGAYINSSAVKAILSDPGLLPAQHTNIMNGLRAVGVMQVMGHYFVRGGAPSGKTELERARPDLAAPLLVNPGVDIYSNILGESNLEKAITAGLIILESKYKAVSFGPNFFYIKGDRYNRKFSSRMQGAVSGYIGLGKQDRNGTTPEAYANAIIGGPSYVAANGAGSLKIRDSEIVIASSNGPSTNGTGMKTIVPPGC